MSSRYRSPDKTTSQQSRPAKCGIFITLEHWRHHIERQLYKSRTHAEITMTRLLFFSFLAVPMCTLLPAEARNMTRWVDVSCYENRCESVRVISPVFFQHRSSDGNVWKIEADCDAGRTRAHFSDGTTADWFSPGSGSVGAGMLEQVCR